MRVFFLSVFLVISASLASADTLSDIMAAHRKVLARLALSAQTKSNLTALDDKYESETRADLHELVSLPKASPRRKVVVAKMKQANQEYKATLAQILGPKWPAYQRAYANAVPSDRRNTTRPGKPSQKKATAAAPTKKSRKRS